MKIYILDKSFDNLKKYESIFEKIHPKSIVKYFTHCAELEKEVNTLIPDYIIVDAEIDFGMITAKKIKERYDNIKIIISANSDKFALESMQKHYFGYLKKPFTENEIKKII